MNRQREIIVTVTYNELGIIIDTKAEPRKTGRWVTKLENHTYECSECSNGIITNKDYLKKHKFCFCCGAKMLMKGEG